MFELFSEDRHRAPHRSSVPVLISTAAHVVVVGVVLAIPILYVSAELPRVPDMVAFVVSTAPSPPPPPPRHLHQRQRRRSRRRSRRCRRRILGLRRWKPREKSWRRCLLIRGARKEFLAGLKEEFRAAWSVALWADWSANCLRRRHRLHRRLRQSRGLRCASVVS